MLDRLRDSITKFLQALLEGLGKQLLFAVKMTIEAAMRQTEVSHQIADAGAVAASAAKPSGGGPDDAFARLLFVVGVVSHHSARELQMLYIISFSTSSGGLA